MLDVSHVRHVRGLSAKTAKATFSTCCAPQAAEDTPRLHPASQYRPLHTAGQLKPRYHSDSVFSVRSTFHEHAEADSADLVFARLRRLSEGARTHCGQEYLFHPLPPVRAQLETLPPTFLSLIHVSITAHRNVHSGHASNGVF